MKPQGRGMFSVCPRPPSQRQPSTRPKSPSSRRLPPSTGLPPPGAIIDCASGPLSPAVRHILERQIIHDAASTQRLHTLEGDLTERPSSLFGSEKFGRPPSSQAEPRPGSWRGWELANRKNERRRDLERRAVEYERIGRLSSGACSAALSPARSPKGTGCCETPASGGGWSTRGWSTMRNSGKWNPYVVEGLVDSEVCAAHAYRTEGAPLLFHA